MLATQGSTQTCVSLDPNLKSVKLTVANKNCVRLHNEVTGLIRQIFNYRPDLEIDAFFYKPISPNHLKYYNNCDYCSVNNFKRTTKSISFNCFSFTIPLHVDNKSLLRPKSLHAAIGQWQKKNVVVKSKKKKVTYCKGNFSEHRRLFQLPHTAALCDACRYACGMGLIRSTTEAQDQGKYKNAGS